MNRRSRRDYDDEEDTWKGRGLIAVGVAAAVAILAFGAWTQLNTPSIDKESGCPTAGPDNITAVLVDLTDPLNGVQQAALRNALMGIRDTVPKFGMLEIYPLTQNPSSVIQPLFSGCSPGSGREVDSSLYGNPELADRQWNAQFANKLNQIIDGLQDQRPGETSPLLEGLQSVAVTAFGPATRQKASTKRTIIFSDMIHNMAGLNLYQGVPRSESFIASPYYAKTRPSLRGATVDVFLIVRDTQRQIQQPPLYKFWVDFIQSGDGYLKSWEPLQ